MNGMERTSDREIERKIDDISESKNFLFSHSIFY
jgi:hypothetical protein